MPSPDILPIHPKPPENAPVGAETPKRAIRRTVLIWSLVAIANVGLIAAAFYGGARLARPKSYTPSTEEVSDAPEPPEPSSVVAVREDTPPPPSRLDLDEVDRLFQSGRYEMALAICQPASNSTNAELRDFFGYRQALCLETLGRWDDAIKMFAKLSSRSTSSLLISASQLGQARVWLRMRRPVPGKALLCDLVLRANDPALSDPLLLADARYFLALALALETNNEQSSSFPDQAPVSHTASDWSLDGALAWGKRSKGGKPTASPTAVADRVVVKRYGPGNEEILVTAFVREMPLASLVARVAEQGQLQVYWTAQARQRVEGRKPLVFLGPLPLPDFLRPICESFELSWKADKGTLRFCTREESQEGEPASRKIISAQRALGEAIFHSPRHPLTPVAFLEMGNLEAKRGRLDESMGWYRRLIREWPRSPIVTEAHYNRGLIQRQAGKNAVARQTFYQVVDRAPAHELTPLAYYHIGRLHLEDYEPDQALSPLRRALASCDSATKAVIAQTTAAAYLLANNPRAANRTLVENRPVLLEPNCFATTAFLDTLARYRMSTDKKRKQLEMNDLMACLLTSREKPLLGSTGLLLLAQAHQEVALHEPLIEFATKVMPTLRGALSVEMNAILADSCYATGKRTRAAKLYAALETNAGRHSAAAQLRLADIAHQERNPKECLKWGRKALEKAEPGTRKTALRLMASSYESTGERDKAILCLTGTPP